MEKEINISLDQFELNFFYSEDVLAELSLDEYEKHLQILSQAFRWFCSSQLKLEDHSFVLNLNICDDQAIQELNRDHRGKDKITDVLSFPLQESVRDGDFDSFDGELELGDLFVCSSVCLEQAKEFNLTFMEEFLHLSTHGFLHVCGYDHEISDEEEKIMEGFEKEIIQKVSELLKA